GSYCSPNPSVSHQQVQPDDLPPNGISLCAGPVHVLERTLKVLLHCRYAEDEHLSYYLSEVRLHEYRAVYEGTAFREGEALPLRHVWQRMGTSTLTHSALPRVFSVVLIDSSACKDAARSLISWH